MSRGLKFIFTICLLVLINIVVIPISSASVLGTVGCSLQDLQAAINATHGDFNEIHVLSTYSGTPVTVSGKVVLIIGGYADCSAANPMVGGHTTISGAAHTGVPVLTVGSNSYVNLHNLELSGAKNNGGRGGGIRMVGSGQLHLELHNVNVINNTADYGGGIYVESNDANQSAELDLLDDTLVSNNFAALAGGGVRIQGNTRLFMLPGSTQGSIDGNSAGPDNQTDGTGGGLQVLGPARADIGSTGFAGGAIHNNKARLGGGIAIQDGAVVRLFSTDASASANNAIQSNTASQSGGGIYLDSQNSLVCGYPANIFFNSADLGGAIFAEHGASAIFTRDQLDVKSCGPEAASTWGAKVPTGTHSAVVGNKGTNPDFATVIDIDTHDGGGVIKASEIEIVANTSNGPLAYLGSTADVNLFSNCQISENTAMYTIRVLGFASGTHKLSMDSCTITGNQITTDATGQRFVVEADSGVVDIRRSIIWQPGVNGSLEYVGPSPSTDLSVIDVISNEIDSLKKGTFSGVLQVADPGFISTAASNANYRLRLDSPAVDYSSLLGNLTSDLVGNPRNVALTARNSHYDIGAFERQTGAPSITFPNDENFDELAGLEQVRGILPQGWFSNPIAGASGWSTTAFSGSPLSAYAANVPVVGASELYTPALAVGDNATVSFIQYVSLETGRDGAIMSITIDGVTKEIISAGGQFIKGSYNGTLTSTSNPLAGFAAWTGQSTGFQEVTIALPPSAAGKTAYLSWVLATDNSNTDDNFFGYWIDNIHVDLGQPPNDFIFVDGFECPQVFNPSRPSCPSNVLK